jgi:hypothetical protein
MHDRHFDKRVKIVFSIKKLFQVRQFVADNSFTFRRSVDGFPLRVCQLTAAL